MEFSYNTKPHGLAYKKGAIAVSMIREKDSGDKKKPGGRTGLRG
jgi:hypothetical protein